MQESIKVRRAVHTHNHRTFTGRRAAAALIAASAGIAMLSSSDHAFGATFTFATYNADLLDHTAWTPDGIPGAGDLAFIRRKAAGDTSQTDFTLNAGAISLGGILYDTSTNRTLSNATSGATNSTLTLSGLAGQPLINIDLAISGTNFTIQGANGGSGTGTLGVVLAASGDIKLSSPGSAPTLNISANISETGGSQSIRKVGSGTLILGGSNSFSGALEMHNGGGRVILDFTNNTGPKIASTGSLIFSGGDLFQNGNTTQNVSNTVNGIYVNSGQNVARIDVSGANQMSSTLNAGAFHRSVGATLNINYTVNASLAASIPLVTTSTANDTYGIISGWLTVGNDDWATNDGAGNILPYNAYPTGREAIGNWQAGDNVTNSATPFSGTVAADITIGSLRFSDSSLTNTVAIASGKTLTIGSGGILLAGQTATTHTISGGSLTSSADEIIVTTGSNKTLAISSVIKDNSANPLTLTKNGSGSMTLSGANTFTGGVFLDTGTTTISSLANAGSPSSLGANGLITVGSVNPVRIIYANPTGTTASNRNFYLGEGGATLQLSTSGGTVAFSGNIDGPGGLTKAGGGTSGSSFSAISITGTKSYGGAIIVNPGLLSVDTLAPIGQPSGLGTGTLDSTVTLGSGTAGTLEFRGTATTSTADRTLQLGFTGGSSGGSINLIMTQPVTLNWTGNLLYNSGQPTGTSFNGASVGFATNSANLRPFRLEAPSGGTLNYGGSIGVGTLIYGSVQKFGNGTVILSGANGYALGTGVNAGTLITTTNFSGTVSTSGTTAVTSLNVLTAATAVVAQKQTANNDPNGTTAIPSLAIAGTGKLDLNNNAMVLYGTTAPTNLSSQVRAFLVAGYNGGAWNGASASSGAIISTSAANSPSAHKTALGYAKAGDLISTPGTFYGKAVPNATDTVVAYVLQGDANMDGVVNALDFNALASNFGSSSPGWVQGDFNYDNTVSSSDFDAIAANFGMTTPIPAVLPAALPAAALPDATGATALGTLVPEPASVALLGLLGGLAAVRRRR